MCKMNPKNIVLEWITLIVFKVLLIIVIVLAPESSEMIIEGLVSAIIAAGFGIPASKPPHRKGYAVTASVFAVHSSLVFIRITWMSFRELKLIDTTGKDLVAMGWMETKDLPGLKTTMIIMIVIFMICTVITSVLSVKSIQTAMYHESNSQNLEAVISITPIEVPSPSANSYPEVPPPIGEEHPSIFKYQELPPYSP